MGMQDVIGKAVLSLFNIPIPTTSKYITQEQKEEVSRLLQPGDILLETNNEYPGWQLGEKLFLKTDWTHLAMYMGDGKIAEATPERKKFSAKVTLNEFLDAYHVAVARPNYKTEEDKLSALKYMKNAEGAPYDYAMDVNDESKLYCSEAPYHALRKMPHPLICR